MSINHNAILEACCDAARRSYAGGLSGAEQRDAVIAAVLEMCAKRCENVATICRAGCLHEQERGALACAAALRTLGPRPPTPAR